MYSVGINGKPYTSHTRTVVRECFKGDDASQWKNPKFDPLATPKPLNRSSQKLAGVITFWVAPGMQNFFAIGSGVSAPPNTYFAVPFDVTSVYVRFLCSSIRLQLTPLNRFLRKIGQMMSFRVRKCLLGSRWLCFIFRPFNFRKKRHFGDPFWLDSDSFFRPKIDFTWGCSNIKLPLIVVVAPEKLCSE